MATYNPSELRARIRKAFTSLRRNGILTSSAKYCCSNCACTALFVDLKRRRLDGAAYYHTQDLDFCKQGDGMRIGYGARLDKAVRPGSKEALVADTRIGCMVVVALEAQMLNVEWDGNPEDRIHVVGLKE